MILGKPADEDHEGQEKDEATALAALHWGKLGMTNDSHVGGGTFCWYICSSNPQGHTLRMKLATYRVTPRRFNPSLSLLQSPALLHQCSIGSFTSHHFTGDVLYLENAFVAICETCLFSVAL